MQGDESPVLIRFIRHYQLTENQVHELNTIFETLKQNIIKLQNENRILEEQKAKLEKNIIDKNKQINDKMNQINSLKNLNKQNDQKIKQLNTIIQKRKDDENNKKIKYTKFKQSAKFYVFITVMALLLMTFIYRNKITIWHYQKYANLSDLKSMYNYYLRINEGKGSRLIKY